MLRLRRHLLKRTITGLTVLTLGLAATASPAFASVSTDAGFEFADGNLYPQEPIRFDWNSFANTTWNGTAPYRTSSKTVAGWTFTGIEDAQAANSDTAFAGGTKQDNDCAGVGTGKAPNKYDLERVYVTSKTVNGDVFLGLSWVRIPLNTTSSSAHIGFEFNKGTTACPAGSNGLVRRTAGDMLIVYDFEGGTTDVPTITLRRWITSGACEVGSSTAPCWGKAENLTAQGFAEAKVNTVLAVTDTIAPVQPDLVGINEFGEAGINLSAAGVFSDTDCESFGKAYAVSRSSGNSGNAQMKDLVGPGNVNISNCGRVIIRKVTDPSPDATNTTFNYTSTGGLSPASFGLLNGGVRNYGNTVFAGSYSVTESDPSPAFALTGLDCSASNISHGTIITPNLLTRSVSFDLKPLDTVDCTFTNKLQRGALRILKQTTKAVDTLVKKAGATFSVTGLANFTVKDNNAPAGTKSDESAAIGEVCVSGLAPGNYTVNETTAPPGYDDAAQTNVAAVVLAGTDCSDSKPASSAVFINPPTADIQVNYRDGGSTETSLTSIVCNVAGDANTTKAAGWQATSTYEDIPIDPSPKTITCTIVIDP